MLIISYTKFIYFICVLINIYINDKGNCDIILKLIMFYKKYSITMKETKQYLKLYNEKYDNYAF
jgi:hypothetical protein